MANGNNVQDKQRSLSGRMSGLEEAITQLLVGLNKTIGELKGRLDNLEEEVSALSNIQGFDEVAKFISDKRIERARAASAQEKASLDQGIADGYVSTADTVGERSLIVGQYSTADGKVQEPGRVQLIMPGVHENFRPLLMGQAAGAVVALPGGNKFTLLEIYTVDEEKAVALQAAAAAKATADATSAAGTAAAADETATASDAPDAAATAVADTSTATAPA